MGRAKAGRPGQCRDIDMIVTLEEFEGLSEDSV